MTSLTAIAGSLLLATAAPAAELGDIAVRSYIGQPLSADIELVQLAPDEAASLQVRLAQENVYRGANISMNPALAGLHMVIVRRDGRQYLRVSTTRPIEADYLHLFLELSGAGRQEVRAATVWLQADPNPGGRAGASPMAAVGSPAPAPLPPAPVSATEPSHAESGRSRAAPMPSLHESEVGVAGGLRASAPARRVAPVSKPAASRSVSAAEQVAPAADGAVPAHVAQALLPMPNLPLPKGVKRAPAPAACSASPALAAKECAAFDAHSQELNSKLSELEGKLKVLQGALGGVAAAKGAAPAALPAAHGKPASASATASASVTSSAAAKLPASASTAASLAASAAEPAASAAGEAAGGERWVPPPGVQGELAKARAAAAAHGEASEAAAASASASAEASAAASGAASDVASGPVKKVKVLPKLKYKKEKPPEPATGSSNLPLIAAGAGVVLLVLGLAGWLFWRKKRGAPPLKIGQLFRKKKATEAEVKHEEAPPLEEVTPESLMQQ
ncbi:type IV pilus assembly protein FimV [Duganella qianjiadongensis]|uniref:LPXTG cell wall anchor domain-containing protein n=1 Tax=Duganella qianjiadongensis TaxID=2692176 RepID=A0ABW9VKB0_9BURK|nr:LPXTG cell wall anchor domain-containing protein [Duganella qianjiadongensis]MYM40056.1 LPXTG cell wall anchor domain-containing protein [Duganella qianjiadongensis]